MINKALKAVFCCIILSTLGINTDRGFDFEGLNLQQSYTVDYKRVSEKKDEYRIIDKAVENIATVTAEAIYIGEEIRAIEVEEKEEEKQVDWYTEEEQSMLEYIVQQEVRGASIEHKRIITQVVINRVKSELFPNSIREVILQRGQFSSVDNYYSHKYEPDADTKEAVRQVLHRECEDLTNGALYFYAPKWASSYSASYFENSLTFLFELEGHRFFK